MEKTKSQLENQLHICNELGFTVEQFDQSFEWLQNLVDSNDDLDKITAVQKIAEAPFPEKLKIWLALHINDVGQSIQLKAVLKAVFK